ncbi:hypothetical protein [Hyphococcus sp.]|uniref:hypothetical protein n=1 Tax=Hyphococcus sp. TaxID=2038636 RepID=UPI0035C7020C
MRKNKRIFFVLLIMVSATGCSTLSFDQSAERWRDSYCLKEPLDRACESRRPPYDDAVD